jgi:regulator of sirC expression with transglutaminase-like and TPR domain
VLLPQAWLEYRDRGLAHAELGQSRLAVQDLDVYLAQANEVVVDRQALIERLAGLRRTLG